VAETKAFGGPEKNFAQSKDSRWWQEQKKQRYALALQKQRTDIQSYIAAPTAPLPSTKSAK